MSMRSDAAHRRAEATRDAMPKSCAFDLQFTAGGLNRPMQMLDS